MQSSMLSSNPLKKMQKISPYKSYRLKTNEQSNKNQQIHFHVTSSLVPFFA